jgi:hypothetical protein
MRVSLPLLRHHRPCLNQVQQCRYFGELSRKLSISREHWNVLLSLISIQNIGLVQNFCHTHICLH